MLNHLLSFSYPVIFVGQGSAEREARETHKRIKDTASEAKKTAEDVREKVNAAADKVIILYI